MGTADELALDILLNALSTFSREQLGIRQVVVGGQNDDWPVPKARTTPFFLFSFFLTCVCYVSLVRTFLVPAALGAAAVRRVTLPSGLPAGLDSRIAPAGSLLLQPCACPAPACIEPPPPPSSWVTRWPGCCSERSSFRRLRWTLSGAPGAAVAPTRMRMRTRRKATSPDGLVAPSAVRGGEARVLRPRGPARCAPPGRHGAGAATGMGSASGAAA